MNLSIFPLMSFSCVLHSAPIEDSTLYLEMEGLSKGLDDLTFTLQYYSGCSIYTQNAFTINNIPTSFILKQ